MIKFSVVLSTAFLLVGCQSTEPAGPPQSSFLRANITGAVAATYEGTGDFWTGGNRELGRPMTFGINSQGRGSAEGHRFSLWRQREGRAGRGSYALSPPDYTREEWDSFAAVYSRVNGETMEAFVAQSGVITITASSPERVEGTFRFTGIRYCASSISGTPRTEGSCRPSEIDPEAPTLDVSGTFVAAQFEGEAVPLLGH